MSRMPEVVSDKVVGLRDAMFRWWQNDLGSRRTEVSGFADPYHQELYDLLNRISQEHEAQAAQPHDTPAAGQEG